METIRLVVYLSPLLSGHALTLALVVLSYVNCNYSVSAKIHVLQIVQHTTIDCCAMLPNFIMIILM